MSIPYMPLYISDYLADAAHLSTIEHGAYLLLIMNYWQKGKPLPNDDAKLARIVQLRIQNWKKIKSTISEFFIVSDQEWHHKRIEKELEIFRSKSDKARLAGQISGQKRREKREENEQQPLNDRSTSVEQTPNHKIREDTDNINNISLSLRAREEHIKKFEVAWGKYPAVSKGSKTKAEEKFLKLAKNDPDLPDKILQAIIDQDTEQILKQRHGHWCPEWKHFITWLNQSCWENEVNLNEEFWKNEKSERRPADNRSSTVRIKSDDFANKDYGEGRLPEWTRRIAT